MKLYCRRIEKDKKDVGQKSILSYLVVSKYPLYLVLITTLV